MLHEEPLFDEDLLVCRLKSRVAGIVFRELFESRRIENKSGIAVLETVLEFLFEL